MNHEMLQIVVIIIILITSILEFCFMLVHSGTLCAKQKVLEFDLIYCLGVDMDRYTFAPPIPPLNAVVIVVLELFYVICEIKTWMHNSKSRIQVQPMVQV